MPWKNIKVALEQTFKDGVHSNKVKKMRSIHSALISLMLYHAEFGRLNHIRVYEYLSIKVSIF